MRTNLIWGNCKYTKWKKDIENIKKLREIKEKLRLVMFNNICVVKGKWK